MLIKMKIETSVKLVLITVLLSCGVSAVAQQSASQPQKMVAAQAADRFEVALGFNATYADQAQSTNTFWLTGGSAEVAARLYHAVSLAVNVAGLEYSPSGTSAVGLNLLTFTAGPRLSWSPPGTSPHKMTIFGEGLVGGAHGFDSVFPATGAPTSTANSLAVQASAGADVALSQHVSLRILQGGYLRTALPNSTNSNNVQNDFQVGAGIVFRSGH